MSSNGLQSVLSPAGHAAELIGEVSWVLIAGAAVIFVGVLALTIAAVFGGPRRVRTRVWILGGGVVFPVVVLTALLAYGLFVGQSLSHHEAAGHPRIQVMGKRWWWEVRYESPDGTGPVVLANELHLPAGGTADLVLGTGDVIHSFWVPSLAGKVDMIPGLENRLVLQPRREGIYRGQCAEYCGDQHARMALDVIVESPQAFDRWLALQAAPAVEPSSELTRRGRDAFFSGGCATCHTIRGTAAAGRLGPDLTHLASRRSIGAGTLPNHAGTLAAWVAGTQQLKPGSLMPSMNVYEGEDLHALVAYLGSLR